MKKTKYKKQIALGYDSKGKQVRKWIYADSKNELNLIKAELQQQYDGSWAPHDITFGDYSTRWKSIYKDNKELNTVEMYNNTFKHFESINHMQLKKITSDDLQYIINKNNHHAETCQKINMVLNSIFNAAIKAGVIKKNPAENLDLPKVVRAPKRALRDYERDAVRDLLSLDDKRLKMRDKMFLAVEYYLGLRPEETRGLMIKDFDKTYDNITIQRAVIFDVNHPVMKGTKTENIREMPIPIVFKPLIKAYLSDLKSPYLFVDSENKLISKQIYTDMWDKIRTAINEACGGNKDLNVLGKFTAYIFRREYATNLYYSGISIKKAAYLMGHNSTKMILEIYAQLDNERENIVALRQFI